ncbi:MAG: protein kinase, partial [Proteobacteria bacterium]|nr:protein kinase [Pseudomonadota bacterium]
DGFLAEACDDDDELEAEIRSLLDHHTARSLVLTDPTADVPRAEPRLEELPDERYRVLDLLGEGGFGEVVRCFDTRLRRTVAAKQTRAGRASMADLLLHEARLLAYLDHPGVVPVYDVHPGQDAAYTMKVLDGDTLKRRLDGHRARRDLPTVPEAIRIVSRIAETMANAHAKGVMHLDLKPSNVMLQPYGQVSVIDWGIARFFEPSLYDAWLGEADEPPAQLPENTHGGAGTPGYMPPEQFAESDTPLGPPADVYAVGTMLFELLTGRRPFYESPNLAVLLTRKAREDPPLVSLRRPDVPERLEDICRRMLARDPAERPASFEVVLDELAALNDFSRAGATVRLVDGQVLFHVGEPGGVAFHILQGAVSVRVEREGREVQVATRHAGDIIGELSVLSETPRTATVVAVGPTLVRALDWEALEAEIEKVHPMIGRLLRTLSDKLVEAMDRDRDS